MHENHISDSVVQCLGQEEAEEEDVVRVMTQLLAARPELEASLKLGIGREKSHEPVMHQQPRRTQRVE